MLRSVGTTKGFYLRSETIAIPTRLPANCYYVAASSSNKSGCRVPYFSKPCSSLGILATSPWLSHTLKIPLRAGHGVRRQSRGVSFRSSHDNVIEAARCDGSTCVARTRKWRQSPTSHYRRRTVCKGVSGNGTQNRGIPKPGNVLARVSESSDPIAPAPLLSFETRGPTLQHSQAQNRR